jgi:hypothetical protein
LAAKLILHTFDKAKYQQLVLYCHTASTRDPTFKYQILPDRIIVECPSKDSAYRRGVRIASLFKCFFEVEYVKEE